MYLCNSVWSPSQGKFIEVEFINLKDGHILIYDKNHLIALQKITPVYTNMSVFQFSVTSVIGYKWMSRFSVASFLYSFQITKSPYLLMLWSLKAGLHVCTSLCACVRLCPCMGCVCVLCAHGCGTRGFFVHLFCMRTRVYMCTCLLHVCEHTVHACVHVCAGVCFPTHADVHVCACTECFLLCSCW